MLIIAIEPTPWKTLSCNLMKKLLSLATIAALIAVSNSGCQNKDSHTHSHPHPHTTGTHRMGTPKENYQMSDESMPSGRAKARRAGSSSADGSGTHRMGTPKENYQMSNEQMKRN
jgi:hypothetical protein